MTSHVTLLNYTAGDVFHPKFGNVSVLRESKILCEANYSKKITLQRTEPTWPRYVNVTDDRRTDGRMNSCSTALCTLLIAR